MSINTSVHQYITMRSFLALCAVLAVASAQNLVEKAEELGLTTFVQFAEIAGLTEDLSGEEPYTLFAPSNDAFDALPDEIKDALTQDPDALRDVLLSHMVLGNVTSDQLENELLVDTAFQAQNKIRINIYENGAVLATGSPISATDAEASNGIIHTLDKVIFPPGVSTIYRTLAAGDEFVTLASLLFETGLSGVLDSREPATIFAPNDDAFNNLPEEILIEIILNPELLIEILTYHVLAGTQYSLGLTTGQYDTLSGATLDIVVGNDGSVSANGSPVYDANFPATNGVIHSVNDVLLPIRFRK